MPINSYTDYRKTWFIDISGSENYLLFAVNIKTKRNGNIMSDGCDVTSVAAIGNGFVEVLQTEIKV